jgi:hypothetical protein
VSEEEPQRQAFGSFRDRDRPACEGIGPMDSSDDLKVTLSANAFGLRKKFDPNQE